MGDSLNYSQSQQIDAGQEQKNSEELIGLYGWVPYHVVSCSSEEHGTSIEALTSAEMSRHQAWESQRLAKFPVEIILRFHYRIELDYVIINSKDHLHIPAAEVLIGDGLSGSFLDATYRLAGQISNISERIIQAKVTGIGSYLKLIFKERPNRSGLNPYAQISIKSLRVT
jgi:centrosomal protein CEP104